MDFLSFSSILWLTVFFCLFYTAICDQPPIYLEISRKYPEVTRVAQRVEAIAREGFQPPSFELAIGPEFVAQCQSPRQTFDRNGAIGTLTGGLALAPNIVCRPVPPEANDLPWPERKSLIEANAYVDGWPDAPINVVQSTGNELGGVVVSKTPNPLLNLGDLSNR